MYAISTINALIKGKSTPNRRKSLSLFDNLYFKVNKLKIALKSEKRPFVGN